jgi:hypothetical protein
MKCRVYSRCKGKTMVYHIHTYRWHIWYDWWGVELRETRRGLNGVDCAGRLGFYESCFAGGAITEDRLWVKAVNPRITERHPAKTYF